MKLPSLSVPKLDKIIPKRRSKTDALVVVDVGSSMVRAAVVEVREQQVAVLGKAEVRQESGSMWGGAIGNLNSLISTMNEAMGRAMEQAGVESDQMVLGLGGALVGGVTTLAHVNRPNPQQKVDDKELGIILQQVTQSALADAEGEAAEQMVLPADKMRLVNSGLTTIALDGYVLTSPLGFTGKEVEVGLFNAFVSDSTMVALQKMLVDLNVDLAALASEPYVVAQAVVNAQSKPQAVSALLIDVGSGTTSVTLIQQGAVAGSVSFAMGGQSVTAAIAKALSVPIEEAEKQKLDFSQGSANDTHRHNLQRTVEKEIGLWLQAFKLSLSALKPEGVLPETVYLTGAASQLAELTKELEHFGWEKAGFARKPSIERLRVSNFNQIMDTSHALTDEDVALAGLALLVGRQYLEDPKVAELFQHSLKNYASA